MTIEFEEGMQVKIVAPEGFDLDEYCNNAEWYDIHYFAFMKEVVGNTVLIAGNAFDPERNCVEVIYQNEIYEFPTSWIVPLNSKKTKPSGKDFLGNLIREGDQVVYARSGYRCFQLGTVQKITPTGARIVTGTNPYSGEPLTFFQNLEQIVKKP